MSYSMYFTTLCRLRKKKKKQNVPTMRKIPTKSKRGAKGCQGVALASLLSRNLLAGYTQFSKARATFSNMIR